MFNTNMHENYKEAIKSCESLHQKYHYSHMFPVLELFALDINTKHAHTNDEEYRK